MPKAAMNKDYLPMSWKDQVRPAWQVFSMKPKTISQLMGQAADGEFWFRI
jgi:hypothetical protein